MRAKVRADMSSVPQCQLDGYIPPVENEIGNIWSMAKDGRRYFHHDRQVAVASAFARRGRTAVVDTFTGLRKLRFP